MSPTVLNIRGFRFYFISREEEKLHVHVQHAEGEAKFWLTPEIALAHNFGLKRTQLNTAKKIILENLDEIQSAWQKHFQSRIT